MITVTFNFTSTAAAAALFAKLNGTELGAIADTPLPSITKEVAAAAVEKPRAAKPAPSPSTAAAAVVAAPAVTTEATPPAADVSSASPSVDYPTLQKAVLTLHKKDPTAAVPIAKSLGADNFKGLKDSQWAEALRLVLAKTAELEAA